MRFPLLIILGAVMMFLACGCAIITVFYPKTLSHELKYAERTYFNGDMIVSLPVLNKEEEHKSHFFGDGEDGKIYNNLYYRKVLYEVLGGGDIGYHPSSWVYWTGVDDYYNWHYRDIRGEISLFRLPRHTTAVGIGE